MSATNLHQRRANLLAHKTRVDAQLELLDEMIREQEGEASAPVAAPETPAPKASRPATGEKPGPVPRLSEAEVGGFAERLAAVLLAGPMAASVTGRNAGMHRVIAGQTMKRRPDWFHSTGQGPATRWELTEEGRRQAEARASG